MSIEKSYILWNTLDINDGKTYAIQNSSMPPPAIRKVWGGDNIFRDGSSYIESKYQNRVITLTVAIRADSHAELRAAIRALYEEAVKSDGVLTYRPVGCTATADNLTFDILGPATVDVPPSPDGMWQDHLVSGAVITFMAKPFARGAEVELQNLCRNAALDRDANGDGTPNYWNLVGTATLSLDTAYRKYGVRSLKIVGAAANDGAKSDTITITASTDYAATFYTWVREGTMEIRVVGDNSGELDSTTTTAAGWNRGTLTFTTGAGDGTVYIEFRQSGTTNLDGFADGAYIGQHTAAPAGWCGYRGLVNHTDNDAGDVGYWDVADIPGDVPAQCMLRIEHTTGSVGRKLRWAVQQNDYADLFDPFWEMEDVALGGNQSKESDASASGGYHWRVTSPGAGWYGLGDIWIIGQQAGQGTLELQDTYEGTYHVYARIRINGSEQYKIKIAPILPSWWPDWDDREIVTDFSMNEWGMVNLGAVDIPPVSVPDGEYIDRFAIGFQYYTFGSGSLDIDYIWLVPVDNVGIAWFPGYTMVHRISIGSIDDVPHFYTQDTTMGKVSSLEGMRYIGYYPYLKSNTRARFMFNVDRRKFLDYDNEDNRDWHHYLYGNANVKNLGQGVKAETTTTVKTIWLYVKRYGSPTDDMTLEIQGDAAALPDNTPIANGTSGAVDMTDIDDEYFEWVPFVFATAPSLTAGTQYHLVLLSDQGALDATNYITWGKDLEPTPTDVYADGQFTRMNEADTWSVPDAYQRGVMLFKADISYNLLGDGLTVYLEYVPRFLLVP